jgi:ABC-type sugar transport system ATPase subunit
MNHLTPIIEIRGVTKRFPGVVALDDVSFDIAKGELHAIVGENGAGKSTLMKILSGVIPDFGGELLLHGQSVQFRGTRDAERAGVSIIHQELNLVEQLSAAANIFLGRERRNRLGLLDDRTMEREAQKLFERLECAISPRAAAGTLRVGDQQLIEIAKALSLDTEILIMDEPTSALTESEVARLYRVIERLRERGVTILYISHKMDEVFRLADRITVLRDGKLVRSLDRAQTNAREVTHLMVGREIEAAKHHAPRTPGDTVLEVRKLSLPWPGHARGWRLRDVSFSLRRGEILGIAGLMGAGRTELLESLFGASDERPLGEVRLNGRPALFRHPAEARRAGVALVTEDRKRLGLFANMTVRENITICTLRQLAGGGIIRTRRERTAARSSIDSLAVRTAGPEAPITTLSGGNQQKCIIGRWLMTQPQVLLLDDPTRGVDVGAKAELYRLMDQLCRDGMAIIVTSSELPELLTVSDRILVLCEGRLTGEFSRAEATEQRIMEAATRRGAEHGAVA